MNRQARLPLDAGEYCQLLMQWLTFSTQDQVTEVLERVGKAAPQQTNQLFMHMTLPFNCLIPSFSDELMKIAAKVPYLHGTNSRFPKLRGGIGEKILARDPNPRALYTASKTRKARAGIEQFAREATRKKGGEAVIAQGKMDTKKGWRPFNMKPGSPIDVADARELTTKLDSTASKAERGSIWKQLNQHVGSWHNPDIETELKVKKWSPVKSAPRLRRSA